MLIFRFFVSRSLGASELMFFLRTISPIYTTDNRIAKRKQTKMGVITSSLLALPRVGIVLFDFLLNNYYLDSSAIVFFCLEHHS